MIVALLFAILLCMFAAGRQIVGCLLIGVPAVLTLLAVGMLIYRLTTDPTSPLFVG